MRIKKINSILIHDGEEPNDTCYSPIYIVRDDYGKVGIRDSNGLYLLGPEYDTIKPLGYGVWQISKEGKFGLIALGDAEMSLIRKIEGVRLKPQIERERAHMQRELQIMDFIPCQYDYVESLNGPAFHLRNYDPKDTDAVYFQRTGDIFTDMGFPMSISMGEMCSEIYYFGIKMTTSGENIPMIYNTSTREITELEPEFYPTSGGVDHSDSGYYLTCCSISSSRSIIYKLNGRGITKSMIYDCIPTAIQPYDAECSSSPLFYKSRRNGKIRYIDENLKEIQFFARIRILWNLITALSHFNRKSDCY